jgi:hypothetical protein
MTASDTSIAPRAARRGVTFARLTLVALCLLPAVRRRCCGAARHPQGLRPARFGTRWDKAQQLFPKAEVLPDGKNLGAPSVGGPFVHRLYLTEQTVEGLPKPVNVELRFWKKNLWVVQVYWGENSEQDVIAMLTKQLGPNRDEKNPLWVTDTVQTTAVLKQHTYGSADLALSGRRPGLVQEADARRMETAQPGRARPDGAADTRRDPGRTVSLFACLCAHGWCLSGLLQF